MSHFNLMDDGEEIQIITDIDEDEDDIDEDEDDIDEDEDNIDEDEDNIDEDEDNIDEDEDEEGNTANAIVCKAMKLINDKFSDEDIKQLKNNRDIDEALYTCSEGGYFEGLDIEADLAVEIWKVVEYVKEHGFPEEYRL